MSKRQKNLGRGNSESFVVNIISYKREIFAVFLISFLTFLTLSLVSFSPKDNSSFYYFSSNNVVHNWCGVVGTKFAGFIFYLFGGAALLLIPFLGFLTYLLLKKDRLLDQLDRILASASFLFTSSALLGLSEFSFYGAEQGGFFGYYLTTYLSSFIGVWGAYLLFGALLWISGCFIFRASFLNVSVFAFSFIKENIVLFVKKIVNLSIMLFRKVGLRKNSTDQVRVEFGSRTGSLSEANLQTQGDSLNAQSLDNQEVDEETLQTDIFFKEIAKGNSKGAAVAKNGFESQVDFERFKDLSVYPQGQKRLDIFGGRCFLIRNSVLSKNMINALEQVDFQELNSPNILIEKEIKVTTRYELPDPAMFDDGANDHKERYEQIEKECQERAKKLEEKLNYFGIEGKVTAVRPGPIITLFEYTPAIGTKISKITSFEDDLAMVLQALSIRILAPIPGQSVVGFEISNQKRQTITLSEVFSSEAFKENKALLPMVLGVDIIGNSIVEDLVKMPHLLVAGSTGSGKSVGLNLVLMGLLCKLSFEVLKLILVDPKRLEFSSYHDIPHLIFPIITDPRKVPMALKWVVGEMERRYEIMAKVGVKNLDDYHEKQKKADKETAKKMAKLPFIVVMIDELADLMIVVGKDVELYIARIAQMARAAGIHMILATQRPSVDVLTGVIKINFPSRIAFRVSSKIDSKTILDSSGAEKLLGRGDMLYLNPAYSQIRRLHGAFVTNDEIGKMTDYLRDQCAPEYLDLDEVANKLKSQEQDQYEDELLGDVVQFLGSVDEVSISMIQRRFRIGFNRSARIIEELEMRGILAPAQGSKPRKVLR